MGGVMTILETIASWPEIPEAVALGCNDQIVHAIVKHVDGCPAVNDRECDCKVSYHIRPPDNVLIGRDEAGTILKDTATKRRALHFKPILEAVRHYACKLLLTFQGGPGYVLPPTPWVIVIGDDFLTAKGPAAFDQPSLDTAIRAADYCVLVTSGPERGAYEVAATHVARHRHNVIIIETQPYQQEAWQSRIQTLRGADVLATLLSRPIAD
jgi:hypothetical protein